MAVLKMNQQAIIFSTFIITLLEVKILKEKSLKLILEIVNNATQIICKISLCENSTFSDSINSNILKGSISYILSTDRLIYALLVL